jgi:hypothetical protein
MKRIAILGLVIVALGVAPAAQAVPIVGAFSLVGVTGVTLVPVDSSLNALTNFTGAVALDFTNTGVKTPGIPGDFLVVSGSFDLAPLVGSLGAIRDFSFTGSNPPNYPSAPVLSFQSIAGPGFGMDLLTVSVTNRSSNQLILNGTSLFYLAGKDPTPGTYVFTANTAGGTFSYSASEAALHTPEPASLLLFGTGLVGLRAWRKRRQ